MRVRHAGATLLAASFLLSAVPVSPFSSLAAPLSWSDSDDNREFADLPVPANTRNDDSDQPADGASSVRPRGMEAPVDLLQTATDDAEPAATGADPDPGDGPPPSRQNIAADTADQDRKSEQKANIRMWPMPAESYTFTQAFGCVPQIAQFYQPGAGCPADRPVVHTGLDMAAPEGTPFYAAASGWVTESGYDREVGVPNTRIIIQHEGRNDGYATEYLHWIASFVDIGDHVEAGELIGEVGSVGYSTGPHLHFSLIDLDSGEHVDPTRWLPKEPGTEGYRGITPRRAAMRLPAGTTAGVPEHSDPNPPEVPTRADLPEAADARQGRNDRDKRKKAKQREERRNADNGGKTRTRDSRNISGKDGATSENGTATSEDKQADRERERTRKRERNRDGAAKSKNASGENGTGDSRNAGKKKTTNDDTASAKDDKRASRKDENRVEQTDTRDKGNDRSNNGGGSGGNKQNRQKDATQQVVDDTPSPDEEAASGAQTQPDETEANRDDKDLDNGDDTPGDNSTRGQTDGSDKRSDGARNSEDAPAEDVP